MPPYRDLAVMDAAELIVLDVIELTRAPGGLLYVDQMRRSAQSARANIAEAFGRGSRGDRDRLLRIARGETEETLAHLTTNFACGNVGAQNFWRIRNRLVTISKMLNALVHS